jgi:hypothetical protein
MANALDTFLTEAGMVVQAVIYVAVFVGGVYVGYKVKGALGPIGMSQGAGQPLSISPVISGGVKYRPEVAGNVRT